MNSPLVGMIDHALLHPTQTDDQLREGCELAKELSVASVCVKPYAVPLAMEVLDGSGVAVGTVIGFPHGSNVTEVKVVETRFACEQGASEVDMVVNIGKVLSEDWDYVEAEIRAIVDTAHSFGAITKVIFENDYLDDDRYKIRLCEICRRVGAEFIKTSTGFGFVKQASGDYNYQGATEHDIRLMRQHAGEEMQVKAAGGIRSFEDAEKMIALGVTRLGTSGSAAIAAGVPDPESY